MKKRLRDYQKVGRAWLASGLRVALADDKGLGKTIQAIAAVEAMDIINSANVLVITRKVALGVWQREIKECTGENATVITSSVDKYSNIPHTGWLITTFALSPSVLRLRQKWPLVIVDEAHLYRNQKNNWESLRDASYGGLFLLTGSPIVGHITDVWPLLRLMDPEKYRSRWKWIGKHFLVDKGDWGEMQIGSPINPEVLREELRGYFLRRLKTMPEIASQMPPKIRQAIPIQMTPRQRSLYNQMADGLLINDAEHFAVAPNKLTSLLRLRQLLVTPQLLATDVGKGEIGALIPAIKEAAEQEFDEGNGVAVFTPFSQAIPFLRKPFDYLGAEVFIVKGGMSLKNTDGTIQGFQAHKGRKVLISTIGAATSWSIPAANAAFFAGYDFTPEINFQAEDRLHRIVGTVDTVRCHYFVHEGTVDEHIMDILDEKVTFTALAFDPEKLLKGKR